MLAALPMPHVRFSLAPTFQIAPSERRHNVLTPAWGNLSCASWVVIWKFLVPTIPRRLPVAFASLRTEFWPALTRGTGDSRAPCSA